MGKINWPERATMVKLGKMKGLSLIIFILIILARTLQLLFFFNTRNDMTYQILAAQNLYRGYGLSIGHIGAADLSLTTYQQLTQWPPGFSLLFLSLYKLLGENYTATALVLNIGCAIILLYYAGEIIKLFDVSENIKNFYLLLNGFTIFYFYQKPCTDSIAICFFMLGLFAALKLLKGKAPVIKSTILLVFAFTICGYIKYMYLPVAFLISLFLIFVGIIQKKKSYLRSGMITFISLLILFGVFLLIQKNSTGNLAYIKQPERGFFPENLLSFHPFIPASLTRPESLSLFIQSNEFFIINIFKFIHVPLFIVLVLITCYLLIYMKDKNTFLINGFALSLVLICGITLLLFYLSLTVAKEDTEYGKWTYVEEPRYYGAIHLMIQMGIFIAFSHFSFLSRSFKFIFLFLLLFMLPEFFRGLIFTANRLMKLGKEEYGWQQELRVQKFAASILEKNKNNYPGSQLLLTGSSDWYNLRTSLFTGIPVFEDITFLNEPESLHTKKPVLLFVQLRSKDTTALQPFIHHKEARFLGSYQHFLFYSLYIHPH